MPARPCQFNLRAPIHKKRRRRSNRCQPKLEFLEDRTLPTAYLVPSGVVGWWPAENSGVDIIGGNHGTLQNGVAFAAGEVRQAFSLDGVDDWISTNQTFANDQSF